ncbi:unnamed protein product [Allacma fusca]|uniref:Uncharacterized protein n=1 Tax=Allacma fusca TaxID=39272 RepID=A0A8J2KLM2_9HEXA|nr:unnamed protein product [Allacma fusca]
MTVLLFVYVWTLLNVSVFAASWDSFILAHTINPETDKEVVSGNKVAWQTWLVKRDKEFRKTCPSCRPLLGKPVNSIVVTTTTDMQDSFASNNTLVQYGGQYYWSENLHPIYVFKTNKNTTNIYNCGNLYVLAKLDTQNKPLHFHGMNDKKQTTGNINFNYIKCKQVS